MHVVEVLLLAGSGQQAAMPWLLLDTPGTASYRVSNRCRSIVPVSALLLSTDAVCAQVILQLMPTYLTPTATAVCIHLGTNVPAASGNRAVQRSTPRNTRVSERAEYSHGQKQNVSSKQQKDGRHMDPSAQALKQGPRSLHAASISSLMYWLLPLCLCFMPSHHESGKPPFGRSFTQIPDLTVQ